MEEECLTKLGNLVGGENTEKVGGQEGRRQGDKEGNYYNW